MSALLTLFKNDIRDAVWDFVQYPWRAHGRRGESEGVQGESTDGSSLLFTTANRDASSRRLDQWKVKVGLPIQGKNFEFIDESDPSSPELSKGEARNQSTDQMEAAALGEIEPGTHVIFSNQR